MLFLSLAFILMTFAVCLTLVTCCRQAMMGKSIHNITGAIQIIAGTFSVWG